jgi:hypothetical protein
MDALGKRLTTGFESLVSWLTQELRHPTLGLAHIASPDLSPVLIRALNTLRHMPYHYEYRRPLLSFGTFSHSSLFESNVCFAVVRHVCQEILQARRLLLVRRFIDALTGSTTATPPGAASSTSHSHSASASSLLLSPAAASAARPIELFAHDSIRYVSDMCAWLHQAVANERDVFATLLNANPKSDKAEKTKDNSEVRAHHSSGREGSEMLIFGMIVLCCSLPTPSVTQTLLLLLLPPVMTPTHSLQRCRWRQLWHLCSKGCVARFRRVWKRLC